MGVVCCYSSRSRKVNGTIVSFWEAGGPFIKFTNAMLFIFTKTKKVVYETDSEVLK